MSAAHDHDPTVPKQALIAAAIMLLTIIALTAAVSFGLLPKEGDPEGSRAAANIAPAQQRSLHFADRAADGAVVITDAGTGETVKVIGYGEEGFTRATLRRLAKRRAHAGIGTDAPFTLTRWENGALSLEDPETGAEAEIYGFGPDHVAAFAELLEGSNS